MATDVHSVSSGFSFTGIIALFVLLFSLWLTYRILRRTQGRSGGKSGCFAFAYVFLVVFILSGLLCGGAAIIIKSVHGYLTLPKYSAVVVDHRSYLSEDSDGNRVTMYQPKLAFTDGNGQRVEVYGDISSSSPKALGSTVSVGYRAGMKTGQEFSLRAMLLMYGLGVMLAIMGYVLVLALCYALGRNTDGLLRMGAQAVRLFIIPGAMLLMFGMLTWVLADYWRGNQPDMPLWALGLAIFFAVTLFFAMLGYAKMLFLPNDE